MNTKQFVEVYRLHSPESIERYEQKMNSYLELGSKIVNIHSTSYASVTGHAVLVTVVYEAEQPEGE